MTTVRLRDTRRANWFWVQNVLIDVFQPVIGPLGVTVYNALCRDVRNEVVDVTFRELGEAATVSKDTAQRMVAKMLTLKMLGVRAASRGRKVYELYDLEDAAGPGDTHEQIARLRTKLAEAERAGTLRPAVKSRQESALEEPGLFDAGPMEISQPQSRMLAQLEGQELRDAHEIARKFQVAPEALGLPPVSVGDTEGVAEGANGVESLSPCETACLKTGGVLSQKEGVLSQNATPYLMIKEETKTVDKEPPNPPGGRALDSVDLVLAGIARLKPRQGDLSDLREQVTAHLQAAGFAVKPNMQVPDRGDGRPGFVDLWCWRPSGLGSVQIAIECDGAWAREKTLAKLRRIADGVERVLILRTADPKITPMSWHADSKIGTIAMGWPAHEAAATITQAQQQARAAVGAARSTTVARVAEISAASVRAVFASVRDQVAEVAASMGFQEFGSGVDLVPNPLTDWDAAMGSVSYERHEVLEGTADTKLLVLSSRDAWATKQALSAYGERISRAMAAAFGCPVQIQVIAADSG